jgi:hypothetical protein
MPFESVTIVPAGEVSAICRSLVNVWVMFAVTFTLKTEAPGVLTVTVEVITLGAPLEIGMTAGLLAVGTAVVPGAAGNVVTFNDQEFSEPPFKLVSSLIVRVQIPLGFSPINAARASSGVSGVATVRFA